ncbi:uncharacterized protein LOC133512624 isoform X2 [Syngnathoides biaculeatus]|uniref:uncharacterized protein LOC133512624 isoform X2 n=1 Tax=Syngnathoides biaculeatus TaxID=300417 RepID=UPI002ADD4987|nr:uncharacterized protein LOC133512624 isoform X2 [Syngnathoides biaculeatus]
MVHTCVVAGCRNRRTPGTGLSFYRFPRDPERKQRWIAAVNRQGWAPNDGSRLCSTHFISGKQVKNPRSPDYVPSVFTPLSLDMKEPNPPEVPDKQEARVEAANALLFLQCQGGSEPEETSIVNFDDVFKALRRENRALRESVEKMSLSENCLRNDAEKVKFYTGLPNFFVLETVMLLLSPHMDAIRNAKLSKFQQLLLTLMRLRLDLRNQDLAYRFGVKVGTVVRTVNHVINIMSSTLVPTAVFWPSRAELRKNLPAALHSSCPDCAVIVDCFAVPCEGPVIKDNERGAAAAACNVLNYLIGVAPQGVVTFVSRGVLGNFSPRNLAQGSGFLCKLLPGDVVLASRDLDISDAVAARGARFDIAGCPEDGSSQRAEGSPPETLDVQAHVERVVSMVRQRYTMLTGPVERAFTTTAERTSNLSTFDKIVQVACALNNLCISAAPLE